MFREGEIWYIIEMGAIFCHVRIIIPERRGIPWITSDTQKWKGASPSFIASAKVIINEAQELSICIMVHWLVDNALIIIENIIIIDAVAWVIKYLIADSVFRGWCGYVIIGIMASVLISKPIQVAIQWLLRSVVDVPNKRLNVIIINTYGDISMGRV